MQSEKTLKFIAKAKLKHGDKFDYSLTEYTGVYNKVKIGCHIHEVFEQSPNNHLNGNGCNLCAIEKSVEARKDSKEEFIRKSREQHGDKFEYDSVNYISSKVNVDITCPIHGIFSQMPVKHISGNGCSKCKADNTGNIKRGNLEDFTVSANIVHENKYDYSHSIYIDSYTKMDITCPIHGVFEQSPNHHLQGVGCPKCKHDETSRRCRYTTDEFVSASKETHGDTFDYSMCDYITSTTKIKIGCKIHGIFEQRPSDHIRGSGCPKCSNNESKIATEWLDSLNIESLIREYDIPEYPTYNPVDGYDPLTNTVYQFHGDFWHGNPRNHDPDDINVRNKKTFGELYRLTCESDDWIRSQGYNLIVMWEMDFKG